MPLAIFGFVGEIFFEDKVVVHYKDGRVLKGHTKDFDPQNEDFTLQPYVAGGEPVAVAVEDLKAVFHVRTFEGNRDHAPARKAVGHVEEPRFRDVMSGGRKALLEFTDGERMWGFAAGLEKSLPGFFFFPTDPQSNNLRVYVVRTALRDVVLLDS